MALGTIFAGLAGGLGGLSKSLEEQEKLKRQQEALKRQEQLDAQQRQQQQFLNEMATRQLGLQEQAAGDRRASDILNQLNPNENVPPEIAAILSQSPIFQARTQTTQSPPSKAIGGTMSLPGPVPVESNLDITERPEGVSRTVRKPTAAEQSSLDSKRALDEFLATVEDPRVKGALRAGVNPTLMNYEDPVTKRQRDAEMTSQGRAQEHQFRLREIQEANKSRQTPTVDLATIDALATAIAENPEHLGKLDVKTRTAVLGHIARSGGDIANKRNQAVAGVIGKAEQTVNQMLTAPGFEGAVGAKGPASLFGMLSEPFAGTGARDYARLVEQLKAQLTLPQLEFLRGLGHMSDREFKAISDSVTALDRSQSEEAFKKELHTIQQTLQMAKQRLTGLGASSQNTSRIVKNIPGIPGAQAESLDGGQTWKRIK